MYEWVSWQYAEKLLDISGTVLLHAAHYTSGWHNLFVGNGQKTHQKPKWRATTRGLCLQWGPRAKSLVKGA